MASNKRRIQQLCRKTADSEVQQTEPEERLEFDSNKKILRAKRRYERPQGPKISLLGNTAKPLFTKDQKRKGLNQSFIEAAMKAYKIDNTYNLGKLFSQYTEYLNEMTDNKKTERNNKKVELLKEPFDLSKIFKSDLKSRINSSQNSAEDASSCTQNSQKREEDASSCAQHSQNSVEDASSCAQNSQKSAEDVSSYTQHSQNSGSPYISSNSSFNSLFVNPANLKKEENKDKSEKSKKIHEKIQDIDQAVPVQETQLKAENANIEKKNTFFVLKNAVQEAEKTTNTKNKEQNALENEKTKTNKESFEIKALPVEVKTEEKKKEEIKKTVSEVLKDASKSKSIEKTEKALKSKSEENPLFVKEKIDDHKEIFTKTSSDFEADVQPKEESPEPKVSHEKIDKIDEKSLKQPKPKSEKTKSKDNEKNEIPKRLANFDILFCLQGKIFIRKTSRFNEVGFHKVIVYAKNNEKFISIFNTKDEIISVSLNKTSVKSEVGSKELAFVDPSSALLYKIKLATIKDSNALRIACSKKNVQKKQ